MPHSHPIRLSFLLVACLLGVLVLGMSPVAAEDGPVWSDPCGGQAGVEGGEPATLPHLDLCEADVQLDYSARSLVLRVTATMAAEVIERGAQYRFAWTNDGCQQFVEVRDAYVSGPALLKHGCDTEQVVSMDGFSPDACARPEVGVDRFCYGEPGEWLLLDDSAVSVDGATITVEVPVHAVLDDEALAAFAPGTELDDFVATTAGRAAAFNTQGRETSATLNGANYTVSPADSATSDATRTVPQPPLDFNPDNPHGTAAIHMADRLTVTTDQAGQAQLIVPEDVVISSSGITLEADGDWAGLQIADPANPNGFSLAISRFPDHQGIGPSIQVAEQDAEAMPAPYNLLTPRSGFRNCSQDCRMPAGSYRLLAITTPGDRITATLTVDGAESAPTTTTSALTPIEVDLTSPSPIDVTWDPMASSGGGTAAAFSFGERPAAAALSQFRTRVDSGLAGELEVTFCVTVALDCQGTTTHTYAANTAQSPEGLVSFLTDHVPAGEHGSQVGYTFNQAGGGSFTATAQTLFAHPIG